MSSVNAILGPILSADEARLAEARFQEELAKQPAVEVMHRSRFTYAKALLRSKSSEHHFKAVALMEELYDSEKRDSAARREYLLYLAAAYLKKGDRFKALAAVQRLLDLDPKNAAAREMEAHIQEKLEERSMVQMAVFGGALMAVGSLIGIAIGRNTAK